MTSAGSKLTATGSSRRAPSPSTGMVTGTVVVIRLLPA